MLLDFSRLRSGVERVDRRYEPEAFNQDGDDFRVVAPVELHAELRKDGRKVRLAGAVRTLLETACSRCLEPFTLPVNSTFDLLFLPATENQGPAERAVEDEDVGVSFYHEDAIDLGEVLREQFYLTLPMKPLCREDCQGLCPTCGINRNREVCSCQVEWVDPRLEVLKQLKPTLKPKG
jgi:uncharacterized protein